jgi:hypothetical protein
LVDAVTADSGHRFRIVGEVIGQPHGRLLCHDIMISRCQAAKRRTLGATNRRLRGGYPKGLRGRPPLRLFDCADTEAIPTRIGELDLASPRL